MIILNQIIVHDTIILGEIMPNSYYETFNQPTFSLMGDDQFKSYYSNYSPKKEEVVEEESLISPSTAQASARGAQSGGLSGALISGGVNSALTSGMAAGGPYAIAAGLLLSELQAAQEAKAQEEAQRIQNEKERNTNMANQLNSMSRTVFKV